MEEGGVDYMCVCARARICIRTPSRYPLEMASSLFPLPASNAFTCSLSSSSSSSSSPSSASSASARPAVVSVSLGDRRNPGGSLAFQAATMLGPPARFESSKLKVVFLGEDKGKQPVFTVPRTYALAHCDLTANLTLAVSDDINIAQWRRGQTKFQKDDVVAEWKKIKEEISLHVHCYVSGANILQELAAEFRYYIFCKELPLVLNAVVHGDSAFFTEHPELLDASVWVYFHSSSRKFNRLECWGPLKDATQRTLEDRRGCFRRSSVGMRLDWPSPERILHALVAFFL